MSEEKLSDREILIREKVAAGLSRVQAEAVIDAQDEHDAAQAKTAKKAAKESPKDSAKDSAKE